MYDSRRNMRSREQDQDSESEESTGEDSDSAVRGMSDEGPVMKQESV